MVVVELVTTILFIEADENALLFLLGCQHKQKGDGNSNCTITRHQSSVEKMLKIAF